MTLRRKIVALTLSLLLLFAMTAAASVLLQRKISEQFSRVVDDYLPLNAAVATIDVLLIDMNSICDGSRRIWAMPPVPGRPRNKAKRSVLPRREY